jgi:hypothetical protein
MRERERSKVEHFTDLQGLLLGFDSFRIRMIFKVMLGLGFCIDACMEIRSGESRKER